MPAEEARWPGAQDGGGPTADSSQRGGSSETMGRPGRSPLWRFSTHICTYAACSERRRSQPPWPRAPRGVRLGMGVGRTHHVRQ